MDERRSVSEDKKYIWLNSVSWKIKLKRKKTDTSRLRLVEQSELLFGKVDLIINDSSGISKRPILPESVCNKVNQKCCPMIRRTKTSGCLV